MPTRLDTGEEEHSQSAITSHEPRKGQFKARYEPRRGQFKAQAYGTAEHPSLATSPAQGSSRHRHTGQPFINNVQLQNQILLFCYFVITRLRATNTSHSHASHLRVTACAQRAKREFKTHYTQQSNLLHPRPTVVCAKPAKSRQVSRRPLVSAWQV